MTFCVRQAGLLPGETVDQPKHDNNLPKGGEEEEGLRVPIESLHGMGQVDGHGDFGDLGGRHGREDRQANLTHQTAPVLAL